MISAQLKHITASNNIEKGSQIFIEEELQKYFRTSPPLTITNEFKKITGSADDQLMYLSIALKVIEELDVEPVQAFGLLEALRPVIFEKFTILTSRFIGKSMFANSRASQAVFGAIDLYARLTATYDSVIEEAKYFGESQTFIMGSAIHRALADKSRLVLCYLQLYMDIPDDIWKHMNRLYITADEYNIHSQVIPDQLIFGDYPLSIKNIYTYTQVLAACGAGSLNIDETLAVSELLKAQIKTIKLSARKPEKDCLCVDPKTMLKARFHASEQHALSDMAMFYDFSGLEKIFNKQHFTQVFVNAKRYILLPDVAIKIYTNLTEPKPVASDRQDGTGKVTVRPGLLLNWLSQKLQQPKAASHEVTERNFRNIKLDFYVPYSDIALNQLKPVTEFSAGIHTADVIDFSHHGYCLQWSNTVAPLLSIGEIIVLNDPQLASQSLCQIVWMRSSANGKLKTGVSVLSSCVVPVYIRPVAITENAELTHGMLLCNQSKNKVSYSLVVEKDKLSMGKIISLIQNENSYNAQVLEVCNSTAKYQVFNIAFYETKTLSQ